MTVKFRPNFKIPDHYDYSKSTEENYSNESPLYTGKFAKIRELLDYSYHTFYTYERQLLQDQIIDFLIIKFLKNKASSTTPKSLSLNSSLNSSSNSLSNLSTNTTDSSPSPSLDITINLNSNSNSITIDSNSNLYDQADFISCSPWMVFTAGSMGVGKSFTMSWLGKKKLFPTHQFIFIDPDEIRSLLPEYKYYLNNDHESLGNLTQKEAGYISEILVNVSLQSNFNVLMDGSLRDWKWYKEHFLSLRKNFLTIRLGIFYVKASIDRIIQRAEKRSALPELCTLPRNLNDLRSENFEPNVINIDPVTYEEQLPRKVPRDFLIQVSETIPQSIVRLKEYVDLYCEFLNEVDGTDPQLLSCDVQFPRMHSSDNLSSLNLSTAEFSSNHTSLSEKNINEIISNAYYNNYHIPSTPTKIWSIERIPRDSINSDILITSLLTPHPPPHTTSVFNFNLQSVPPLISSIDPTTTSSISNNLNFGSSPQPLLSSPSSYSYIYQLFQPYANKKIYVDSWHLSFRSLWNLSNYTDIGTNSLFFPPESWTVLNYLRNNRYKSKEMELDYNNHFNNFLTLLHNIHNNSYNNSNNNINNNNINANNKTNKINNINNINNNNNTNNNIY